MINLAEQYFEDFNEFKQNFSSTLAQNDIVVLDDFLNNKDNIEKYYDKYVDFDSDKIVLCGLNPGRFGAGLTGVPFIDFKSLSKMLSNIKKDDGESSAQFFFELVKKFGIEKFYKICYVTNISKFGYSKKSSAKNVNYPKLPNSAQDWLFKRFIEEMNLIKPKVIIPLSDDVAKTLKVLTQAQQLDYKIAPKLNHPAWVMTYKKKDKNLWLQKYYETIMSLI